jgi:hypothetical protein
MSVELRHDTEPAGPGQGPETTPAPAPGDEIIRTGLPAEHPADAAGGPLLADAAEQRGNWQRIQAGFVDDPRNAVSDAANLLEHVVQALAGTLQQRQRQLRTAWDADDDGGAPDTERLRATLLGYRALFDKITAL